MELASRKEFHENGILGKAEVEHNLNVCRLKNGNIALGLRKGDTSIVYELDEVGVQHVISLLNQRDLPSG